MNKTKQAIYDSTILIFSKNGYDGATMDEVAQNAGVAKGTLYYHFKSKEELFYFVISEGLGKIRERIAYEASKVTNSLDKLKMLCKVHLVMVYEKKDFFNVVMSQLWGQDSRQFELRKEIATQISIIEDYIKAAMNDGLIKNADSYFMAYTVFGIIYSAAVYKLINADQNDIEEVITNLIQYILKGIQV